MFFPPFFRHTDFTSSIIDVGELIFSGQAIKVAVYANAQLIFPCLFRNKNTTFHKIWYVEMSQ
jgi:hypothetical protein